MVLELKSQRVQDFLSLAQSKENLHPWMKVNQAGRPLPPNTLGILVGLALKLISLRNHNYQS